MKESTKEEITSWAIYGGLGLLWLYNIYDQQDRITHFFGHIALLIIFTAYLLYEQIKVSRQYTCIFTKDIITGEDKRDWRKGLLFKDGIEATLTRKISIPFPPYQGLTVSDRVENVIWDDCTKQFICKVPPIEMTKETILGNVLLHWINRGWEIEGRNSSARKALEEWKKKQDAEE